MGESFPVKISLPRPKFGLIPEPRSAVINQFTSFDSIGIVKDILSPMEFIRVKNIFMGPLMKMGLRTDGLAFSAKIVHCILSRNLVTTKENELWFHFGGQPMRFSIREFHMVTGLKCSGDYQTPDTENQDYHWDMLNGGHSLSDLEAQLRETNQNSADERFSLAMLFLIEGIVLQRHQIYKFPFENVKKAQDIQVLMNYPWGRDAYKLLFKSVKNNLKENVKNKDKYDIHGFPWALHLWILAFIPLLQSTFSQLDMTAPRNSFICERFVQTQKPSLTQVVNLEASEKHNVTCILPALDGDEEDSVSLEDVADAELDEMVNLIKQGYQITKCDWDHGAIDIGDAMEAIA